MERPFTVNNIKQNSSELFSTLHVFIEYVSDTTETLQRNDVPWAHVV